MSDDLLGFPFIEPDDPPDGPPGSPLNVETYDVRDRPGLVLPAELAPGELPGEDPEADVRIRPPARFPVVITRPVATRPAAGRVVVAGTVTVAIAAPNTPTRIGVPADLVAQQRIAYLVVSTTADVLVQGAEADALTATSRYKLRAGVTLRLDHVANLVLFPATADAEVSWLVVGAGS